jgi:hypothetical protein
MVKYHSIFDSCTSTVIVGEVTGMQSGLGLFKYQAQTGAVSKGEYFFPSFSVGSGDPGKLFKVGLVGVDDASHMTSSCSQKQCTDGGEGERSPVLDCYGCAREYMRFTCGCVDGAFGDTRIWSRDDQVPHRGQRGQRPKTHLRDDSTG